MQRRAGSNLEPDGEKEIRIGFNQALHTGRLRGVQNSTAHREVTKQVAKK
jgi:hypothetical protein